MLPSCDITQLATLTSLTIKQARPCPWSFRHANPELEMEGYVLLYVISLSCLPCLQRLRLEFLETDDFFVLRTPDKIRRMWLPLLSQHLTLVPQLELYLSSDLQLVANSTNFNCIASLTNLSALDVTFKQLDGASVNISKLSTLTGLTSLRVASTSCVNFCVCEQHMHNLCRSLSKLTQLKLNMRPDCFQSAHCFSSLNMLTNLKVLELGLALDVTRKDWKHPDVQLPRSCRLGGLPFLVLEGYTAYELPHKSMNGFKQAD
jgi:hypothetical protein